MSNKINKAYFVTGTDTGVGKTWSAIALMQAFQNKGYKSCGMKPIASGGIKQQGEVVSEDALLLMHSSNVPLSYKLVNPVCLESPASPNIAADLEGKPFTMVELMQAYEELLGHADKLIVEGIGGWRTPCIGSAGLSIMVKEMSAPVILVVGLRLGCINHALLTLESIYADGCEIAGWIANCNDPDYHYQNQTVEYLLSCINAPLLGKIPYQVQRETKGLGGYLNLPL